MTYSFSAKSVGRLTGVHNDLQRVMLASIPNSPLDFGITEGLRTKERQQELFDSGKSQTMRSRHLTGHAVDITVFIDGKVNWDLANYKSVTDHIKKKAKELDIAIVCGIDWKSFVDGPHIELNRDKYP
jgi:peptidoglycan L-alanyl-D-glutamate endopeptidase CwlK